MPDTKAQVAADQASRLADCPVCDGQGEIHLTHWTRNPELDEERRCPAGCVDGLVYGRDVRHLVVSRRRLLDGVAKPGWRAT